MAFRKLLVAEAKVKVARLGAALAQAEEELLLASADSDSDQCSETRSPASVPVLSPSHASSPASPPPAATPSGAAPALASDVMKKWLHFVREVVLCQAEPLAVVEGEAPAEAAAILFAQHYGEQLEQFDPAAIANLRTHYSDAQVAEILAYVRTVTLGGLIGNTLDALLDHMRRIGRSRAPT